ncbi:hypothetical protein SERLA73DRAFT_119731 [Serpula lacrymans var. lacrymans S7.3]|uniref:Uncharacterized protein n=1 Tax=Serpula lacrymans var. lacrymans (strain S7.3) TaxID=936435 RepID=F8PLZ2_SERL3|nr:hypothetical protein SERLA73DRAFT_119731 [Serpula lacrymans var. lacrymans S7.3]
MAEWDQLGVEGPVLLANKDNDATLQGASHGADCGPTPAGVCALNESIQGAVKAISLAGGIFNNKDKKKGQHDTYCWYMENRGLALHCLKTLTEVVAIVIYGGTVSHPYSQMVWGPGTESLNVLDLGPLHKELKQYLKLILTNPKLIFGANVAPKTACFGCQPWCNPVAMAAAFKLASKLEHLRPVTLALFQGALDKWESFTTEFAINQATQCNHTILP